MQSVRLLFLTPQLPYPARQGTAIRNWGLISHLAARGHAITLLSFAEAGQTTDPPELRAACPICLTQPVPRRSLMARLQTLFSPQADLTRRLWSPAFAQTLHRLVREQSFDFIHIEGLEMAPYLETASDAPPTIYDAHNAEYVIQQRALLNDARHTRRWPAAIYSWLQIPRLKTVERQVCQRVHAVTCVSPEDARALRALTPALNPFLVPNGIDVEAYAPFRAEPTTTPPHIVFTGKMDYRPNVDAALWFIEAIWPRVRAACPAATFVVVGQKPPTKLLAQHGVNGITITGAVEDIRPFIARAAVYVAPLRMGGGTRFKLLEAMASARPIVSTTIGAEGFAVQSGRELLFANTPADFAQAILTLLAEPQRATAIGQRGLAFVRAGYDWQTIVPRLESLYAAG